MNKSHFFQNGTGFMNVDLISESGVYSLIFSSKLPRAKRFKHWVTSCADLSINKKRYNLRTQIRYAGQIPYFYQFLPTKKLQNLNKPEYFHSGDLLNLFQYVQLKRLYYIPNIKKSPILGKMRKSELKSPKIGLVEQIRIQKTDVSDAFVFKSIRRI